MDFNFSSRIISTSLSLNGLITLFQIPRDAFSSISCSNSIYIYHHNFPPKKQRNKMKWNKVQKFFLKNDSSKLLYGEKNFFFTFEYWPKIMFMAKEIPLTNHYRKFKIRNLEWKWDSIPTILSLCILSLSLSLFVIMIEKEALEGHRINVS